MFVSQERGAARKSFQKPNILRRKSKAAKLSTEQINNESCDMRSLSSTGSEIQLTPLTIPIIQTEEQVSQQQFQIVETSTFAVLNIAELYNQNQEDTSQTLEINGDSLTIYAHNAQVQNSDWCIANNAVNVESFLNDTQSKVLLNISETSDRAETEARPKWCLDFVSQGAKDTTTHYDDGSQMNNVDIDKSLDMCAEVDSKPMLESLVSETTALEDVCDNPDIIVTSQDCYTVGKIMCPEPSCNKSFWTEACLEKHKNCHIEKQKSLKHPADLHCPVKKTDGEGVETKCCKTFPTRKLLTKHLNEDHSPEDALYKCNKCGRRFFWAGGARQHAGSECGRAYACLWPGCGRLFRQPCRLREHARAHTGDRPYACHYPGCSWSFRSNSKLVRHARRHTGERRHACAACGRAFLRREHLREHVARHHAAARHHHACTHTGCERSFSSSSSLIAHVKKVHTKPEGKPQAAKKPKNTRAKKDPILVSAQSHEPETNIESAMTDPCKQILEGAIRTVPIESLMIERDGTMMHGESLVVEGDSAIEDAEDRCARTHCTWPMQRRADSHFALDEDTQVEQAGSESCESNVYTVRSDLFLHGNLLLNEDSEFIISRATSGGEGSVAAEDSGTRGASLDELGLIDSHPTGDLTQEELMYADAVDESSFRVFLLNGEELA